MVAEYAGELGFWSTRSFRLFFQNVYAYIPSGPRLFDADGGGFRDDFFRLPIVQNKWGGTDAESGWVQDWVGIALITTARGQLANATCSPETVFIQSML